MEQLELERQERERQERERQERERQAAPGEQKVFNLNKQDCFVVGLCDHYCPLQVEMIQIVFKHLITKKQIFSFLQKFKRRKSIK